MKYQLNINRDVDPDGDSGYILNLPRGYRFYDEVVHVRGYDTIEEIKQAVKTDIIKCNCESCTE